jgi:hypothetical protein
MFVVNHYIAMIVPTEYDGKLPEIAVSALPLVLYSRSSGNLLPNSLERIYSLERIKAKKKGR